MQELETGEGLDAKLGDIVNILFEARITNSTEICMCQHDKPLQFVLGDKKVLPGWNIGIDGMKVGGKRRITCPPDLAYGENGIPAVVPPNATLVFVIELIKIN